MWQRVFEGVYGGSYDHRPCPVVGGRPGYDPNGVYGQCLTSHGWYIAVALLCAGVAMFLQIAANFANDYSDGVRGVDSGRARDSVRRGGQGGVRIARDGCGNSRITQADRDRLQASRASDATGSPGASRAPSRLVASGVPARQVLAAAIISALLACLCGLAITILTGHWWFIALGLVCIAAGWCYVGGAHPYGYRGWGEIAVFVFFGLVATCGSAYALADEVPFLVIWTGVALGLLAVAVLSINNLRDLGDDALHGKRTWMVLFGERAGHLFADGTLMLPPLMLLLEFLTRMPWQSAGRMRAGACGIDDSGARICDYSAVSYVQGMSVASVTLLVLAFAMCIGAVIALHRRAYHVALPMASLSSPVLALGFSALYLIPV